MAASCTKLFPIRVVKGSLTNLSSMIDLSLRNNLLGRSSALLATCHHQVRHKNTSNKLRPKDAKIQGVDVKKHFISKKTKRKSRNVAKDVVEEKNMILAESPVDNVWVRKFYPRPSFSIEESIQRHKSFAQPDMLDNMEGLAYLEMLLNFTTKKQTRFMSDIRSTVILPHPFDWGPAPAILVMCKAEEHMKMAASLGAKHAGTPAETIKMIENGVLNPKDFNHVIATADCTQEMAPIRSYLRDKFPQKARGNLGTDLKAMLDLFYNGYTYETQKLTQSQGKVQVPIGKLNQPTEELVANMETYIVSLTKHRSLALGPFIQSMTLVAPPSPEQFLVKVEDYAPGYQNEEVDSDDDEAVAEAS